MPGEQEEHIGALEPARDLDEELLQNRAPVFRLARQDLQPSCLETATATRGRVVGWRQ
jgi:hypothetical protein